jgi:hypothetical protein
MLWLIDVVLAIIRISPTSQHPDAVAARDRRLERSRWLIYGVIGLDVLMLVVIGVMLWMAG